ncbi:MAG: hypothetical protein MI867_06625, partial [Pseudomonadales bacterium]|nr:hypothetical protein [Pseudomonadales bacterium]
AILDANPVELSREWLFKEETSIFERKEDYSSYIELIRRDYPEVEEILIAGSGNWGFSLNPKKRFSPFGKSSDVDVVIISEAYFNDVWKELRTYHRKNYYLLRWEDKQALNRNGQNVYSGFVSPKWIPDRTSVTRFSYELNTNNYSNKDVSFRKVNMLFFKNKEETIDYYTRGFRIAKSELRNGL